MIAMLVFRIFVQVFGSFMCFEKNKTKKQQLMYDRYVSTFCRETVNVLNKSKVFQMEKVFWNH